MIDYYFNLFEVLQAQIFQMWKKKQKQQLTQKNEEISLLVNLGLSSSSARIIFLKYFRIQIVRKNVENLKLKPIIQKLLGQYLSQNKGGKSYQKQMSQPVVQNVVSFAQIDGSTDLNLKLIASRVQGSRYNRKRFPAVILRKTKPKSTILIFKSGKMIIIGSESEQEAEVAARKSVKDIRKLIDQKLTMKDFKITNIVANADLGWDVDIGRVSQDGIGIKDDNFPGVVYKMGQPVKAVLLFSSGKVVFTGAKNRQSIEKAYTTLKGTLEKYKVPRKEQLKK